MTAEVHVDPCVVCGENVIGSAHVMLGLFAVCAASPGALQPCMQFEPDEDPQDVESWQAVKMPRSVHVRCVIAYFEGIVAEAEHHHRTQSHEGGP